MNQRRQLVSVSLALLATAAAGVLARPRQAKPKSITFESVIPSRFGEWLVDPSIAPIKPTPDAQANLDLIYDQLVTRTYKNGADERVMLTVAYGSQQTDRLKAHRQEVCYAAQGFRISELGKGPMRIDRKDIPVTRFLATLGPRKEPVSYWFTVGNAVVDTRFSRLMMQVRHGFLGEIPDGLLVRISSFGSDLQAAYGVHDQFANALISSITVEERQRFVGAMA